jgi:Family of unknown function (DUF6131)/Protein of unknown function (DUF3040)
MTPPSPRGPYVTSMLVPALSPDGSAQAPPDSSRPNYRPYRWTGVLMILIGLVLLLIGFLAQIPILWTIGIIALAVGLILLLLGSIGRGVGGRRHYW